MDFSKHTDGTTSVKVRHAPGGQSSFSLAWDNGPVANPAKSTKTTQPTTSLTGPLKESNQLPTDPKNSVKVRNPPGGRSNICFG